MLKKSYLKNGSCRVTFSLPAKVGAKSASLCGTFNDWNKETHPMKRLKNGNFSVSLTLQPGEYHFRYYLDSQRWENDWEADEYRTNPFGSDDSIIKV
jgi:1,4-alpha-glucan branching enzyme